MKTKEAGNEPIYPKNRDISEKFDTLFTKWKNIQNI